MTQDRRITDKLPGHPLQWDDSASPSAAPAAGQAGLATSRDMTIARIVRDSICWVFDAAPQVFARIDDDYLESIIAKRAPAPVTADTEQATSPGNINAYCNDLLDCVAALDDAGYPDVQTEMRAAVARIRKSLATPADAGAGAEQARPSFYVIVDAQGRAEYVTMLPHEAQEHINDACSEGVEGAGRWKAIPVYAAAVEQAKDAERYRILRGAKKIPASLWHALETGENIDQEVDFLIALNKTIPMCAPCQEGRYNECQHAIPCVLPAASTPVARPNADCSGDPSNCPDNEGYGCECGSGQSPAPVTAEPAQSIDTPEFRDLFATCMEAAGASGDERRAAWEAFTAHIDSKLTAPADRDAIPADDVQWGHDLQLRLLAASQDVTESEDARQVMAEAACCLAALTGRPVEQGMERAADAKGDQQ